MATIMTVRHPSSGESYAAEIGPSEFYDGLDRILRVAGPMSIEDNDPENWLAGVDGADAEDDADWLASELGRTVGLSPEAVYGADLWGLLRTYGI